ncbi:MAG TPA: DUF3347 domain-containing protein [Luteolibacter sp.]
MKTNLSLMGILLGLTIASPAAYAETHHDKPAAEAKIEDKLKGYTDVSTALYKDNLEGAKKQAADAAKDVKDEKIAKHYQGIADSKSLDEARKHFKELSELLIPEAKKDGKMHEIHCPHAKANWLQTSADEIQNPYEGQKMPHCGKEVK